MTAHEKAMMTTRARLDALEAKADAILSKGAENMTEADRENLLSCLKISFHDSGKIEGAASVDSCACCDFCERMRKAANDNALMICGMCYAAADFWKEASFRRHKLNMRILSSVLFEKIELAGIHFESKLVRINEDGDVVNVTHARNIMRIIETHRRNDFGFWYKNAPAVAEGLQAEGITCKAEKPVNARFVHSSMLIGFPVKHLWFDDVIFTVYPDKETTLQAIKEGSWACNGRKCNECKWNCYDADKNAEGVQHVAEYLRTNKARRAEVLKAYNTKKEEA